MRLPAFCPECGNLVFPDAKSCQACGAPPVTEDKVESSAAAVERVYCIFCGSAISRLLRSPRSDVCLKCFANESVWKKIKPPQEWELGKKIKPPQEWELGKLVKKPTEWVLEQVKDTLDGGESVVSIVSGWHSYHPPKAIQRWMSQVSIFQVPFLVWPGYFIATTSRIIFYVKKPVKDEVLSYPLLNVSSIRITKEWWNKAFGLGANHGISFEYSNMQVNLMGCASAEYDETVKLVDFVRTNKGRAGKVRSQVKPSPDILDQLKRLAELRDKDIITDDEFQSTKQVMLGNIT